MRPLFSGFWHRRPRLSVAIWIAAAALLSALGLLTGAETALPGPYARSTIRANPGEQSAITAGIPPRDNLLTVLEHSDLTVDDPRFVEAKESLWATLRELLRHGTTEPLLLKVQTLDHSWLDPALFVSSDRKKVLFTADTGVSIDEAAEAFTDVRERIAEWEEQHPGFRARYLSGGSTDNEMFALINEDLDRSLLWTVPLTLFVLLWSFGTVVAAIIPMFVALVSLAASLGAAAILSKVVGPISAAASQLVVLLVLAIGIDYSLFIVSRVREETAGGASFGEAVATARGTAGLAVIWSGLTVALSLAGLFLMHDTVLSSMALAAIAAVTLTVLGCAGALPSLLLAIGPRLERGRIRRVTDAAEREVVSGWLRWSLHHPIVVIAIGAALMGALSMACTRIRLGTTVEPAIFPPSMQAAQAFDSLHAGFPDLAGVDFTLILTGPKDSSEKMGDEEMIDSLLEEVAAFPTVSGPVRIDRSADGSSTRYHYIARGSGNDPINSSLIHSLRQEIIPRLDRTLGVRGDLSGTLPFIVDNVDRYGARSKLVFGAVLGLSMIFLLVAFRSVVIPAKAILLNLLSTTASFGVLVILFQFGISAEWRYGVIESFVPPLLFCILFGLSMDYHVFLLSRVREEMLAGYGTAEAVERGVTATSRTITSAALIMVSVFVVIAMLELPLMKQLGAGLAVAVLLDATVVRCLLLPACMVLLGDVNWYFPRWLRWIPELRLGA